LYIAQEEIPAVVVQLARHFEEAGIPEKAIRYLHQAGERAVHLSAYQEGITHLRRGLEMLQYLPDSSWRDQQELMMQLSLGAKSLKYRGASTQTASALHRARDLCQKLGKIGQLSRVLGELSIYHYVRAEYQPAVEFATEALIMAREAEDPVLEVESHWQLGFLRFSLGDYRTAKNHIDQVISYYKPEQHHHSFVYHRGVDAGLSALAYDACCLWCLGYPDQALKRSQETIELVREFDHPFSLADVLCYGGCLFNQMCRDAEALRENAEALIRLAKEKKYPGWLGFATTYRGKALAMQGHIREAITQIHEGIDITEAVNEVLHKTPILHSLAKARVELGQTNAGLTTLTEAFEVMEQTGERYWEPELLRLQAELMALKGDDQGAESSLLEAIDVSRRKQGKSWELRASIQLARLWQKQGKTNEACDLLEPIYNWFTEGFETPDLLEAKALLQEL
jgi:tetratricopeptide (TPR) repeat protein